VWALPTETESMKLMSRYSISQKTKKLVTLRYSPYMIQCCKFLEQAAEYPTDLYLVKSVQLQSFVGRGADVTPFSEVDSQPIANTATAMIAKSLWREFQEMRLSLPLDLSQPSQFSRNDLMYRSINANMILYQRSSCRSTV
jgi:hypothetical protein